MSVCLSVCIIKITHLILAGMCVPVHDTVFANSISPLAEICGFHGIMHISKTKSVAFTVLKASKAKYDLHIKHHFTHRTKV